MPTLTDNMTKAQKAEAIAKIFENVYILPDNNTTEQPNIENSVELFLQSAAYTSRKQLSEMLTISTEVFNLLKKLPKRKASGPSNIANEILRNLSRKAVIQLTYILLTQ